MSIQKYIRDDLAQKVLSGVGVPDKLTLTYLSEIYGVSTRPVRLALDDLIDNGILIKQKNARVIPNPEKFRKKKKLKEVQPPINSYDLILEELIQRSLKSDGVFEWLKEEELAEKYGISRTPIRTILQKITSTGLIEHEKRKGWMLRPFSIEDYNQFTYMRSVLEVEALDLAKDSLDLLKMQQYLDLNYIDKTGRIILQNDFHQYIIDQCGNRYLQDFFIRYQPFFKLFILKEEVKSETKKAYDFHVAILNEIIKKKFKSAQKLLKDHILSSKSYKHIKF